MYAETRKIQLIQQVLKEDNEVTLARSEKVFKKSKKIRGTINTANQFYFNTEYQ